MALLNVGDKAPSFVAKNQNGEEVKLSQFVGKKVILYFYPKDNTPGCTAQACSLNEGFDALTEKGFIVLGVSRDSEKAHQGFIQKYGLRFNLLVDSSTEILRSYGAWGEKKLYGKVSEGVIRTTYIIDEAGIIMHVIKKVNTKDHANQIVTDLKLV